jgi:hypothetical protein
LLTADWILTGRHIAAPVRRHRHAVNEQHRNGAEHCHDEARRLAIGIQTQRSSDETAEQRADDAEHHRHDDAARITSRHQQLRDRADDQTEYDPTQNTHLNLTMRVVSALTR